MSSVRRVREASGNICRRGVVSSESRPRRQLMGSGGTNVSWERDGYKPNHIVSVNCKYRGITDAAGAWGLKAWEQQGSRLNRLCTDSARGNRGPKNVIKKKFRARRESAVRWLSSRRTIVLFNAENSKRSAWGGCDVVSERDRLEEIGDCKFEEVSRKVFGAGFGRRPGSVECFAITNGSGADNVRWVCGAKGARLATMKG